tara:strand:+ start:2698 stop:3228 length:531 start_codon:yes stop_codon:yes gene_type:complete
MGETGFPQMWVYILRLENKKYYVGKTNTPTTRLFEHFNKNGSIWTKKHKPIDILRIYENCDRFDEDKYTIKTMSDFGIDNVRGGSFCQLILSKEERLVIEKMIKSANNMCFYCGEVGHYQRECPDKKEDNFFNNIFAILNKSKRCLNCFGKGHKEIDCKYVRKVNMNSKIIKKKNK